MKKRSLVIIAFAALILLAATLIGPQLVLRSVTQPESAESYAYSDSFLSDYNSVRERLAQRVEALREDGYDTEYYSHAIDEADGLYIDNIYLPGGSEKENLIVLTTGVHGIEGYIGSVMLDVFFDEISVTHENECHYCQIYRLFFRRYGGDTGWKAWCEM